MILSRHLHELLSFKTPTAAVMSLYLDVDGDKSPTAAFRALCQGLDQSFVVGLRQDFQRIGQALAKRPAQKERGLAVFSSHRFGLFRLCALPQPVKARLTLDSKPYLRPLLNLADQHQRYGVALVGRQRARFLEAFMGRVRELEEQALPAPEAADAGYLKAVAARLDVLARNQGFQRLIVGAAPDLCTALTDLLHRALQDNLILDAGLPPDATAADVGAKIAEAESQARRVREFVLVHRLLDGGAKSSALGLRRTLEALEHGRLKTLLVRDGFAKLGRCCPGCQRLSFSDPKCLGCGCATETLFNLADEIAERVLEQGGEVFRLQNATPLDNVGRIGAELRDTAVPQARQAAAAARAERVEPEAESSRAARVPSRTDNRCRAP